MYRWHVALNGDQILSPQAKEKYFAPHADEGSGDSFYGYGWVNFKTSRGTRLLAHNGGNSIFSADFRRYVDDNVVLYHASNSPEFFVDPISDQISRILFAEKYELPPKTVVLDSTAMARFAGTYVAPQGDVLEMRVNGTQLEVTPSSQRGLAMVAPQWRGSLNVHDRFNKRTLTIIEQGAKDNHTEWIKALRGQMSAEEATANATHTWKVAREKIGAFKSATIVGSLFSRSQATVTTARLDFERGTQYARYIWQRGRLVGFSNVAGPPKFLLAPSSDHSLVGFDLASQQTKKLDFESGPGGEFAALKISTGRGETVFKRSP